MMAASRKTTRPLEDTGLTPSKFAEAAHDACKSELLPQAAWQQGVGVQNATVNKKSTKTAHSPMESIPKYLRGRHYRIIMIADTGVV